MRMRSESFTESRYNEIVDALEVIYRTKSFKDITIGDISKETSFTRTSIYNYFKTKEEIFLALLKREYDFWCADLETLKKAHQSFTPQDFAKEFATILTKRTLLLKLLSMNHYDLEENSRLNALVEFKKSYGKALTTVETLVDFYFGKGDKNKAKNFVYMFFPFMFGIYPYSYVTEKQGRAMKEAAVPFVYKTTESLIEDFVLSVIDENKPVF